MPEEISPISGYEQYFITGEKEPCYTHPFGERVTPVEDIPPQYHIQLRLPGNEVQICDLRIAYTFHPEYRDTNHPHGAYLECVDVALDEEW